VLIGSTTPRLEVEERDADGPLALQPAATTKPTKLTTTAPRRADPQRRPAAEAALGTDPLNTSKHLPPFNIAQSVADCVAISIKQPSHPLRRRRLCNLKPPGLSDERWFWRSSC